MEFKGTKEIWKAVELQPKQGGTTHEIQFGEDGECVTDGVYNVHDAKLIASAPDLLEALQGLLKFQDELILADGKHSRERVSAVVKANKAIKKALK